MAENWIEQEALRNLRGANSWKSESASGSLRVGRVYRAGNKDAIETTSYWDVILLNDDWAEVDLNAAGRYDMAKPVRPYVANVAASIQSSFSAGDFVTIKIGAATSSPWGGAFETVADDYNICQVLPGQHTILVAAGGGGGCAHGLTDFGVLIN